MKETIVFDGYRLHLIPTNKFKNVTITIKMAAPLKRETTTLRTLLSFMFAGGTEKYPSTKLFSAYLENLYGAGFSSSIGTKGKAHVINIVDICVDSQYLNDEPELLKKQIELLHDVLFHPNAKEGAFDDVTFKIKKQELKWRLASLRDDKYSYSLERLFDEMGKGQPLGISTYGYEEEINAITSKQLYDYYLECMEKDVFDIYVVGDIDESIVSIFKQYFPFTKRPHDFETNTIFKSAKNDVLEIVEKQDIVQAKLNIGYTIDADFTHPDHYAMTVLNGLFGGFSHSMLFKVVREQNSLCYYVSSSYDAFNGIMIVNAGIETKNYQKTLDLITQELQKIQRGEISQELLDITKGMLENSLRKSNDDAMSMVALKYNRDITHKQETNEDYIQRLNAVTLEDVIRVSQKIKMDTIYLLAGKE